MMRSQTARHHCYERRGRGWERGLLQLLARRATRSPPLRPAWIVPVPPSSLAACSRAVEGRRSEDFG
jgi:hypothetical protein